MNWNDLISRFRRQKRARRIDPEDRRKLRGESDEVSPLSGEIPNQELHLVGDRRAVVRENGRVVRERG